MNFNQDGDFGGIDWVGAGRVFLVCVSEYIREQNKRVFGAF